MVLMNNRAKKRLMACVSVAVLAAGLPASPAAASGGLDRAGLEAAMDAVHDAGMPGIFGEVRDGEETWRGASGVADLDTGRPVTPGMRQRVGSITKTFTAVAVMRLVERGSVGLDAPVGRYLPELVPGERGQKITVRMLLGNTSGIPDYLPYAFPSLAAWPSLPDVSPQSLDDNRFRRFAPEELIAMGLAAPPVGEPGGPVGVYSNTNWLLLGELIEKVTGTPADRFITREVIRPAGLRHTEFPSTPWIKGPHPKMYESFFGKIDPPRDYSVYDMSWVGTGAALVSTPEDLDRFYAELLRGALVSPASLAEMRKTGPVISLEGKLIDYGLGLHKVTVPGCGTYWGHDGSTWGTLSLSLIREDGRRQLTVTMTMARWNELDDSGRPRPHPIDAALAAFKQKALCG